MSEKIIFNQYILEELPETPEGKFGGYRVHNKFVNHGTKPFQLYKINIQPKFDNNKLLDRIVSNNGINAV